MVRDNVEFNEELLRTEAPCGYEEASIKIWEKYMKELGMKHEFTDSMWNSCFSIGEGSITVLISGHIDSCSFLISNITEEGYLHFICQGGANRRTIPDNNFTVIRRDGTKVNAFCPVTAIHLEDDDAYDTITKVEDLTFDVGATNKDEVLEMGIRVGDIVIYRNEGLDLNFGKNFLISQNLDDKASILCLYELAKRLKNIELKGIKVYIAALTQEEEGLRGAKVIAHRLSPDYSIDIDCTHEVNPTTGGKEAIENDIKFGKGAVISFSPSCYRPLSYRLVDLAEEHKIPYQLQVGRSGGTNTAAIQTNSVNCKTALISYPMTSMHSSHEKVDWRDLETVTDLIEKFLVCQNRQMA